jgi:hypothetical protein
MTTATRPRLSTESVTIPSNQELEKIVKALAEAVDTISHPAWIVRRLSDTDNAEFGAPDDDEEALRPHHRQPGDPVPTFEEIGRLFSLGITLRSYLEELNQMVGDLTGPKTLEDLDYIRVVTEAKKDSLA